MLIISLSLLLILTVIGGIGKSIMDTLAFHYSISIFSNIPKESRWYNWLNSPDKTWVNKYKNGNKDNGPAFIGSTTIFVFITDGWHFFQSIMLNCFILNISIIISLFSHIYFNLNMVNYITILLTSFIIFKLLFSITFELFWNKILIK